MKKINFIFGLKKSIFFVIPFLITSCGINLKSTDGSKINFKRENVSCKFDDDWYEREISLTRGRDIYLLVKHYSCTANGVRTYLNGYRENYSDESTCKTFIKNAKGNWNWMYGVGNGVRKNSFSCAAADELKPGCTLKNRILDSCAIIRPPELTWDDYLPLTLSNFYYRQ